MLGIGEVEIIPDRGSGSALTSRGNAGLFPSLKSTTKLKRRNCRQRGRSRAYEAATRVVRCPYHGGAKEYLVVTCNFKQQCIVQNDVGGGFRQLRHRLRYAGDGKRGGAARGSEHEVAQTHTHTRRPCRLTDGETGRREIRGEMRLTVDGQTCHYSNTKTDLCSSCS